ncbi:MAG: polyisoprenyl-teichoic acid--peptidoglycan teichoic acid transferase [Solirubrobacteraceae bacterium]|nr:polyisoprenyl-teichoic acid--peptidoglycan teichoic acid transferase [Solirubrobacteraceae bacterium]
MTAGAVSGAGLLQIDELQHLIPPSSIISDNVEVDAPDPGKPETIMALGTDGRLGEDIGQRSDTILLARLDAENRAITLMSIPRDLRVEIPGYGIDKINAAYSIGGTALTLKTVKALLSSPGHPFKVNHVVEVNFSGFHKLVDYFGCVYVDVDRHYFNDVGGPLGYATIDIDQGYQKLCGADALSYVRYRHTDSDLVRGARQQDFVRQMLRQPQVRSKLTFAHRKQLVRLAGRFVRTDRGLSRSTKQLLSLLKLGLGVSGKPVQQIPFAQGGLGYSMINAVSYLEASPESIQSTVKRFLDPPAPAPTKKKLKEPPLSGLSNWESLSKAQAAAAPHDAGFPLRYPFLGVSSGAYTETAPRVYKLHGHGAYRLSVQISGKVGAYYGIQGMRWLHPPILDAPHRSVVIERRKLDLYFDGAKLGIVAYRTPHAIYWVHNTLTHDLTRAQMLAIARSLYILPEP